MHRFLAIETSSPRLSLAAGDERETLARYQGPLAWRHAESLFDGTEKVLSRLHWPVRSLTGIAVSTGPGSFTGIRIGLAAARTLGQTLKVPVVGISSLETLAAAAPKQATWLCPQIDALRGQIFSALYKRLRSGQLQRVIKETISPADVWMKQVKKRAQEESLWISPRAGCYPDSAVMLELARPRLIKLHASGHETYKDVLPFYIRQAASIERKKAKGSR